MKKGKTYLCRAADDSILVLQYHGLTRDQYHGFTRDRSYHSFSLVSASTKKGWSQNQVWRLCNLTVLKEMTRKDLLLHVGDPEKGLAFDRLLKGTRK